LDAAFRISVAAEKCDPARRRRPAVDRRRAVSAALAALARCMRATKVTSFAGSSVASNWRSEPTELGSSLCITRIYTRYRFHATSRCTVDVVFQASCQQIAWRREFM
jgi:hypothetical protein